MYFKSKRPDSVTTRLTGVRNDLAQMGTDVDICNEVASIRQRHQFEAIRRNRHLARDISDYSDELSSDASCDALSSPTSGPLSLFGFCKISR